MSLRASASFPCNCSGDMYFRVPTIVPCLGEGAGEGGIWELPRRGRRFGEPEIEQLDLAGPGDENVVRFEVAVDDALGVGGIQGVGDLNGDAQSLRERSAVRRLPCPRCIP